MKIVSFHFDFACGGDVFSNPNIYLRYSWVLKTRNRKIPDFYFNKKASEYEVLRMINFELLLIIRVVIKVKCGMNAGVGSAWANEAVRINCSIYKWVLWAEGGSSR